MSVPLNFLIRLIFLTKPPTGKHLPSSLSSWEFLNKPLKSAFRKHEETWTSERDIRKLSAFTIQNFVQHTSKSIRIICAALCSTGGSFTIILDRESKIVHVMNRLPNIISNSCCRTDNSSWSVRAHHVSKMFDNFVNKQSKMKT